MYGKRKKIKIINNKSKEYTKRVAIKHMCATPIGCALAARTSAAARRRSERARANQVGGGGSGDGYRSNTTVTEVSSARSWRHASDTNSRSFRARRPPARSNVSWENRTYRHVTDVATSGGVLGMHRIVKEALAWYLGGPFQAKRNLDQYIGYFNLHRRPIVSTITLVTVSNWIRLYAHEPRGRLHEICAQGNPT